MDRAASRGNKKRQKEKRKEKGERRRRRGSGSGEGNVSCLMSHHQRIQKMGDWQEEGEC